MFYYIAIDCSVLEYYGSMKGTHNKDGAYIMVTINVLG